VRGVVFSLEHLERINGGQAWST